MATLEELKAKIAGNDNKFTLVAERTEQIAGADGLAIIGNIYGTVAPMDGAYVIFPTGQMAITVIGKVEVVSGDSYTEVQTATDEKVRLSFPGVKYASQTTPKFSIVTNIEPQRQPKPDVALENPQILAITRAVVDMKGEPEFMPVMSYNVVHGHFFAVAKLDRPPVKNAKGQMVMQKDTKLNYLLIPDATDPTNAEKRVLPLFTDQRELDKWIAFKDGRLKAIPVVLPFPNVYDIVVGSNAVSVVINPFTPVHNLLLSRPVLDAIVSSEGYQREFVRKEKPAVNPNAMATQTQQKQVTGKLVVPGDDPETRSIRDALSDFGIEHSEVAELHLLLRLGEDGSRAYHIMVDTEDDLNKVSTEIYNAVKDLCKNVPAVEFVGKEEIEKLTAEINLDSLAHRRV